MDDLLAAGDVVMCGAVVAELLALANVPDTGRLWLLLTGLPRAGLDQAYRSLQRRPDIGGRRSRRS